MATAAAAKDEQTAHRFAKDQLKAFVERIERLEEEKKTIAYDIKEVFAEAKGTGFDTKAIRTIIRRYTTTLAGPGTERTISRWISPNGTRNRRDAYCHSVNLSARARALP